MARTVAYEEWKHLNKVGRSAAGPSGTHLPSPQKVSIRAGTGGSREEAPGRPGVEPRVYFLITNLPSLGWGSAANGANPTLGG